MTLTKFLHLAGSMDCKILHIPDGNNSQIYGSTSARKISRLLKAFVFQAKVNAIILQVAFGKTEINIPECHGCIQLTK